MTKKPSTKKPGAGQSSAAVYLIKQTARGAELTPEQHQADIDRIHEYIRRAGGTCSLFANKKTKPDEFVSIIRGLSPARQRQMITVIQQSGDVEALMMHILKGP